MRLDKALADIGKGRDYHSCVRPTATCVKRCITPRTSPQRYQRQRINGLKQALAALGAMCISAGGLVGAGLTSVYMVRSTPDEKDFIAVIGNDATSTSASTTSR